jgi:hypothetical protein
VKEGYDGLGPRKYEKKRTTKTPRNHFAVFFMIAIFYSLKLVKKHDRKNSSCLQLLCQMLFKVK